MCLGCICVASSSAYLKGICASSGQNFVKVVQDQHSSEQEKNGGQKRQMGLIYGEGHQDRARLLVRIWPEIFFVWKVSGHSGLRPTKAVAATVWTAVFFH